MVCRTVGSDSNYRHSSVISTSISPPVERSRLQAASGVTTWLQSAGISLLDDLSVEAKAVRAAMATLKLVEPDPLAMRLRPD